MVSSPLERGVTAMLEGAGNQMWGFTPRLMAPAVRQLGPLGALRWFAANMPRYLLTLRAYGGLRTHLIGAVISLLNGCPYCTHGEGYAFQLIYLRERAGCSRSTSTSWASCAGSRRRSSAAAWSKRWSWPACRARCRCWTG